MRKILKKGLILCMALAITLTGMSAFAFAATEGPDTTGGSARFEVTGYTITKFNKVPTNTSRTYTITKGDTVDILVTIKSNSTVDESDTLDASRLVDSFSGGTIDKIASIGGQKSKTIEILVTGLKYKGTGQSLKLMVQKGTGYDNIEVPISEAKVYTEPDYTPSEPSTPDPIPAPKAIISRNQLSHDIKPGETMTLNITVKNVGKAVMQNPIITLTPSDALTVVGGTTAFQLKNINIGKDVTIAVQVRALKTIQSATQYIDAEVEYDYYNRVSTTSGSAKGRITIPAKLSGAAGEQDDETTSPVPNIIVTKFNYGGQSVAAGSNFNFSFKFKNTSSELNIDNIVVTVDGGENLLLNGTSNSFFFDKIKAGHSQVVKVPMKALKTVTGNAQPVSINFKYEYVDHKKRTQAASDIKLSVPVYQPDRFEISKPVVPEYITEGDEISITLNYVNKSKTDISNVEASLEGNVQSSSPMQTVGNLEPGKSGTIAFAVTAAAAGESTFDIKVSYEDGNGDSKERIFPVTMDVQAMQPSDPGMDDPGMDNPDAEEGGFNWWIVVAIVAVLGIAAVVILKKRKKAKAAKKEQELWDSWDDELNGTGDADSKANTADAGNENKGDR